MYVIFIYVCIDVSRIWLIAVMKHLPIRAYIKRWNCDDESAEWSFDLETTISWDFFLPPWQLPQGVPSGKLT